MVTVEYSEAAVEVLGILDCLEEQEKLKIPHKIIDFLEQNKSKTYDPDIDYMADIEDLHLKDKTKQILAGIYLDYLCPEEEKEQYISQLKHNNALYQEQIKQKYQSDHIFDSKEKTITSATLPVIKKDNLLARILRKVKSILGLE